MEDVSRIGAGAPHGGDLLGYASERAAYYSRWRNWIWTAHLWLSGLSFTLSVLVPFGLALLLYAPPHWRVAINVSTLAASCLALVFYGLDQNQRLPDRAALLKTCEWRLALAISRHLSGSLDEQGLATELEDVLKMHAGFDGN